MGVEVGGRRQETGSEPTSGTPPVSSLRVYLGAFLPGSIGCVGAHFSKQTVEQK